MLKRILLQPQETTSKAQALSPNSIDLQAIQDHIFTERGENIYLGGKEINQQTRELLREQADYLLRSDLWEIFSATITNEAANLALVQSTDWEHIETAKMLHHWQFVLANIIHSLAK